MNPFPPRVIGATLVATLSAVAAASAQPATITPIPGTTATPPQSAAVTLFPLPGWNTSMPETQPSPIGIAQGPDGNLWIANNGTGAIARLSAQGAYAAFTIGGIWDPQPWAITAGPDGNMWATVINKAILRITPAGEITQFARPDAATSIASGPDGNLWYVGGGNVVRMTPSGEATTFPVSMPTQNWDAQIAAGPDGRMWFTGGPPTRAIGAITTGGQVTMYATPSNQLPQGIAAGPDGNMWFVNTDADSIGRITMSGAVRVFPKATSNSAPTYIVRGPDGNMWFTEQGQAALNFPSNGSIGRITMAGVLTEYPVTNGTAATVGITSGPGGRIWFTQNSANMVGSMSTSPGVGTWMTSRPSAVTRGRTYAIRIRSGVRAAASISVISGGTRTTLKSLVVPRGTSSTSVTIPRSVKKGSGSIAVTTKASKGVRPAGQTAPLTIR